MPGSFGRNLVSGCTAHAVRPWEGVAVKEKYHGQFTAKRIILLVAASVAVIAWMTWLQSRGVVGDKGFGAEEWRPFYTAAALSVIGVIVIDIVVVMATLRRTRKLPEQEKDWHGPDPHADRKIPVEAWSPSPVMQAAIKRTLAKQDTR
jgi:hypothetical protein